MGVALIGTSFAWRGYSAAQQEHGKDLAVLPTTDYPGARALTEKAKAPDVPMRPSVLEAGSDLPATTLDGCISDFGSAALINCVYGDRDATRTVALAGGSHAEHWISALDLLGQRHGFKVVTYLKMGCPLSTDQAPIIAFTDEPYPECYQWSMEVVDRLIADRPDYVFTTSTRPRLDGVGDITPEGYLEVWDILSANEIGILAMRDNPWLVRDGMLVDPADCLAGGGDAVACGVSRQEALSEHNPTWELVERFPLLKPLDMSDALCDAAVCRAVEGNVLVYHDSHHLSATYVRTMADELGRQMAIATGWW